jgi:hypothetical protein
MKEESNDEKVGGEDKILSGSSEEGKGSRAQAANGTHGAAKEETLKAAGNGAAHRKRRRSIFLWEDGQRLEPWPEPVDGKALLEALACVFETIVVLPHWASETLALWVLHTYAFSQRDVSTYLGIESPVKRCGKTTLVKVLCRLVNRPVVSSNISSPAFYRVIEEKQPTLIIDEADTVLHRNRELRGILNAGYTKETAYVIRAVRRAETREDEDDELEELDGDVVTERDTGLARYSCWCPKAIAAIGHFPDTLADRCIILPMQRKMPHEMCERVKGLKSEELKRKCMRFATEHAAEIASAQPASAADLNDRATEIWEPLFALADLAGGEWPKKARDAAVGLTARAQGDSPLISLMVDLFMIFVCAGVKSASKPEEGARIFSRDMAERLNAWTEHPWAVLLKGKPVTELWLAQQLRPYGVRPKTIWIGDTAAKGYLEDDFTEMFHRYVPRSALKAWVDEEKAGRKKPEN